MYRICIKRLCCVCWFIVFLSMFTLDAFPTDTSDTDILYPSDESKYDGSRCVSSSGIGGICRKLKDCQDTEDKFQSSDICSFEINVPVYCCPTDRIRDTDVRFGEENSTTNVTGSGKVVDTIRPIVQICQRYYSDGKNGDEYSLPAHSYMASIGWSKKKKIEWKCMGVLISEKHIITDAQCINSKTEPPNTVRMIVFNKNKVPAKKSFNITAIYSHPDFKREDIYHNIAVIKIIPNFPVTELSRPACLWPFIDVPNAKLLRLGFVDPEMKQTFERNISLISNSNCSEGLAKNSEFPNGVTKDLFCSSVKDKCQKDIGGLAQIRGDKGIPFVAGIASVGQYCKDRTTTVYTRLSAYLDWIEPFLIRDL